MQQNSHMIIKNLLNTGIRHGNPDVLQTGYSVSYTLHMIQLVGLTSPHFYVRPKS